MFFGRSVMHLGCDASDAVRAEKVQFVNNARLCTFSTPKPIKLLNSLRNSKKLVMFEEWK